VATTDKVSVSIGSAELRQAKRLASRLGVSLSMFVTEAVRQRIAEQQRREAARAFLATFDPDERASPDEMAELLTRWRTPRRDRVASRNRWKSRPRSRSK
jgi:hypothetical protein